MPESNWPFVPEALIKKLLAAYPLKPYNPKRSFEENLMDSGKAELVLFLKQEFDKQQESGPIPPPLR